jgi:acetyl-CoA acyltransferase
MQSAMIIDVVRTGSGRGKPGGGLSHVHPATLLATWQADLAADPARLNPRGGAIALGHPLGASGTRILATLVNYLESTGGRFGLQTMCEGGGMANATIIERL